MSIYRKTENGDIVKTAGYLVQRWNDQIFTTTHSVVDNKDYYDIDPMANKYITSLTDFTEFQLYINEPNVTDNIFIRYAGKTLELKRSSNDNIGIGTLHRRVNVYTLDDGIMWMDSKLQPTPDNYKGIFTYAVSEFVEEDIAQPSPGQTLLELNTNKVYEYDGTEWDEIETITIIANGWYWMIEFFPDYYFGNGKVVWNGGTDRWDIFTARTARPDEVTIVTDPETNKFSTKKDGDGTKYLSDDGTYKILDLDIEDSLTSVATNKALSANQGRVLNEKVESIKLKFNVEEGF